METLAFVLPLCREPIKLGIQTILSRQTCRPLDPQIVSKKPDRNRTSMFLCQHRRLAWIGWHGILYHITTYIPTVPTSLKLLLWLELANPPTQKLTSRLVLRPGTKLAAAVLHSFYYRDSPPVCSASLINSTYCVLRSHSVVAPDMRHSRDPCLWRNAFLRA